MCHVKEIRDTHKREAYGEKCIGSAKSVNTRLVNLHEIQHGEPVSAPGNREEAKAVLQYSNRRQEPLLKSPDQYRGSCRNANRSGMYSLLCEAGL